MRRLHGITDSVEFEQARSWWWTGRPSVLQSMVLQRVGHDWTTELKVYSLEHSSNNEVSGWWNCPSLFLSTSLLVRCGLIHMTLTLWNSQQKLKIPPGMKSNFLGEVHPSDVRQSRSRSQWCFQRQIWMKRGKYEMWNKMYLLISVQFSSVSQSCPTLYLCQGVFKWSQEAIKEVDLMHILTQTHRKLSQTTNTQRTLQEDLKRHGNALLPPSGNSLSKPLEGKITNTNLLLFPLKATDFYSPHDTVCVAAWNCVSQIAILWSQINTVFLDYFLPGLFSLII